MENMSKYNLKKIWGRLRDYTFLISSFELLEVSIHLQDVQDIAFFENSCPRRQFRKMVRLNSLLKPKP